MAEIVTSELQNHELYDCYTRMANIRILPSEKGLIEVAPFDPASEYHDMNNDYFPVTKNFSPRKLKGLAELVLHNFDKTAYEPRTTEVFDSISAAMRDTVEPLQTHLASGGRAVLMTGHQTRIEPAVVAFTVQDALSETKEEHNDLRDKTNIIITRYLASMNINLGKLVGSEDDYFANILAVAREIGSIGMSFPNSRSMRVHSGIPVEFQRQANQAFARKIGALPAGSLCALVGDGTKNEPVKGVYPISPATPGTVKLMRGWGVQPVASALDIKKPFSVLGAFIPPEAVDGPAIHGAQRWIAETLSERGVPAIFED